MSRSASPKLAQTQDVARQLFTLAITPEQLDDLDRRLRASRFPDTLAADSWDVGTSVNFLARLLDYWRNQFDWRLHEQRINRLPPFLAEIDGDQIHFLHQRGIGPKPMPLIITYGWPGSFLEMERLLPAPDRSCEIRGALHT